MRTREYDAVLHDHYISACRAYDNAVTVGSAKDIKAAETARNVAQKAMDAEYNDRTNPPRAPVPMVVCKSAADVIKYVEEHPLPNIEMVRIAKALAPYLSELLRDTLGPIVARLDAVEDAVNEYIEPETVVVEGKTAEHMTFYRKGAVVTVNGKQWRATISSFVRPGIRGAWERLS